MEREKESGVNLVVSNLRNALQEQLAQKGDVIHSEIAIKPAPQMAHLVFPIHQPSLKHPRIIFTNAPQKTNKMERDSNIVRNFVRVRKTVRNYGNN